MAIIIPSNNTYNLSHDIVRNNFISSIHIPAAYFEYVQEQDITVYRQKYDYRGSTSDATESAEFKDVSLSFNGAPYIDYRFVAFASIAPKYYRFSIKVDKLSQNSTINSITVDSLDDINFSILGQLKTGTTSREIDWERRDAKKEQNVITDTQTNVLFTKKTSVTANATIKGETELSNTQSIEDESGLVRTVIDNGNYWSIEVKLLCGYVIKKIGSFTTEVNLEPSRESGKYEEFVPETIEVSINGTHTVLAVDSYNITVGEQNEKASFSVPESSLLQSGMSPSVESLFQKTIDAYKNGKETAVIRASISEYYDETGELKVSTKRELPKRVEWFSQDATPSREEQSTNVKVTSQTDNGATYLIPSISTITEYTSFDNMGVAYLTKGSYKITIKRLDGAGFGWYRITNKPKADDGGAVEFASVTDIKAVVSTPQTFTLEEDDYAYLHFSITPSDELNQDSPEYSIEFSIESLDTEARMVFAIGDNVIPMIYTYEGTDAPMSRYRDGTPKVFRVCGTKIYYDGAVWQELTLQEV